MLPLERQNKAGKNDELDVSSIPVLMKDIHYSIESAVLVERGGCLMGEKESCCEVNGRENVGDCGSEEKSAGLVLFRPDCSVDNSEEGIAGRNGSLNSDAGATREGRKSSGSSGNSESQHEHCRTGGRGASSQNPSRSCLVDVCLVILN